MECCGELLCTIIQQLQNQFKWATQLQSTLNWFTKEAIECETYPPVTYYNTLKAPQSDWRSHTVCLNRKQTIIIHFISKRTQISHNFEKKVKVCSGSVMLSAKNGTCYCYFALLSWSSDVMGGCWLWVSCVWRWKQVEVVVTWSLDLAVGGINTYIYLSCNVFM